MKKPLKIQPKSNKNPSKINPEASRRGIGKMVGSRNLSGSSPMEFLVDFWRHLGPCWTLNGSQDDAKIIQKSMPKSFKNLLLLVEAPRRPKTAPRRPQGAPKTAQETPTTEKWSQNGTNLASKTIPNLILCQNRLKAKKHYFPCIFLILFYIWKHCFPSQKRCKTVNKTIFVLFKRFPTLEGP